MKTKASLYAVIGGVVGAVLTIAVCSVMPIGAQNGDAIFGEITCTKLNVVDVEGKTNVSLRTHEDGGIVKVKGKTGDVVLMVDKWGGSVNVWGDKDGRIVVLGGGSGGDVWINTDENGGSISVGGMGGSVRLNIDEDGGHVDVKGKAGKVGIGSDEDGGYVNVKGKAGKVGIGSDERGGSIAVSEANGLGAPRVHIGADSLGGGRVMTWDKNGDRLATLGRDTISLE